MLLHEQIEDSVFRFAVDLLDQGDADGLRRLLIERPSLVEQTVHFSGSNYFENPTLLEFVAENPVRHGRLPENIVEVAGLILDAGALALDATLGLVSSGRVPRECGVQVGLIDLLCDRGANPDFAMAAALVHGEFGAVEKLVGRSARVNLTVVAARGDAEEARRLIATASAEERHRALALAAQFGHAEVVGLLLDAGEDPSRLNPPGFHGHSTPLHQAALAGHADAVHVLVERGARLDLPDTIWHGTPLGWALHGGRTRVAEYLRKSANGSPVGSSSMQ